MDWGVTSYEIKKKSGFSRIAETTFAVVLAGSFLLAAKAVAPNIFTGRSTDPVTPAPSKRFPCEVEGKQYEHVPFIKSDYHDIVAYDLYGETYTSKDERLNQTPKPRGALVIYDCKIYDIPLNNAFGKKNLYTDKYFENAKQLTKIPSYSYHEVSVDSNNIYLWFDKSYADYKLSSRKVKLSNGLEYTLSDGEIQNIDYDNRYDYNRFFDFIHNEDFWKVINPSHGIPQTHEARSFGNTAIFGSSFPGGATHQNISLLILRPEKLVKAPKTLEEIVP